LNAAFSVKITFTCVQTFVEHFSQNLNKSCSIKKSIACKLNGRFHCLSRIKALSILKIDLDNSMFYKVFDAVTVTSAVTFIEHFC
jgi:hypothetical protein